MALRLTLNSIVISANTATTPIGSQSNPLCRLGIDGAINQAPNQQIRWAYSDTQAALDVVIRCSESTAARAAAILNAILQECRVLTAVKLDGGSGGSDPVYYNVARSDGSGVAEFKTIVCESVTTWFSGTAWLLRLSFLATRDPAQGSVYPNTGQVSPITANQIWAQDDANVLSAVTYSAEFRTVANAEGFISAAVAGAATLPFSVPSGFVKESSDIAIVTAQPTGQFLRAVATVTFTRPMEIRVSELTDTNGKPVWTAEGTFYSTDGSVAQITAQEFIDAVIAGNATAYDSLNVPSGLAFSQSNIQFRQSGTQAIASVTLTENRPINEMVATDSYGFRTVTITGTFFGASAATNAASFAAAVIAKTGAGTYGYSSVWDSTWFRFLGDNQEARDVTGLVVTRSVTLVEIPQALKDINANINRTEATVSVTPRQMQVPAGSQAGFDIAATMTLSMKANTAAETADSLWLSKQQTEALAKILMDRAIVRSRLTLSNAVWEPLQVTPAAVAGDLTLSIRGIANAGESPFVEFHESTSIRREPKEVRNDVLRRGQWQQRVNSLGIENRVLTYQYSVRQMQSAASPRRVDPGAGYRLDYEEHRNPVLINLEASGYNIQGYTEATSIWEASGIQVFSGTFGQGSDGGRPVTG